MKRIVAWYNWLALYEYDVEFEIAHVHFRISPFWYGWERGEELCAGFPVTNGGSPGRLMRFRRYGPLEWITFHEC